MFPRKRHEHATRASDVARVEQRERFGELAAEVCCILAARILVQTAATCVTPDVMGRRPDLRGIVVVGFKRFACRRVSARGQVRDPVRKPLLYPLSYGGPGTES